MRLRDHLLLLTLGTLAPVLVAAIAGGLYMAGKERTTFELGARERTRALTTAVDAELRGIRSTVEALATSGSLEESDLAMFRQEAQRVMRDRPEWRNVYVADHSGQRVLDLAVAAPARGPLGPTLATRPHRTVVDSGRAAIGDVMDFQQERCFTVSAPLRRHGQVRYVVTAVVRPEALATLLRQQQLPSSWLAAVVDERMNFVARAAEGNGPAPRQASASLQQDLASAREGWSRGITLDGQDIYRAFNHSQESGWRVTIAIPARQVSESTVQSLVTAATGTGIAVLFAALAAFALSKRIAAPIDRLAAAARALEHDARTPLPVDRGVTEIGQLGESLQRAVRATRQREQQLRQADQAKDELQAMLAHELRNPMAALQGAVRLLRSAPEGPQAATARAIIERQSAHMGRLVHDLLDVHLVLHGKSPLSPQVLDLGEVVDEALNNLALAGRFDQHAVQRAVHPIAVRGDAVRLQQIVTNLVDNALKYTPAGGTVTVELDRDGQQARLRVRDTGEGMSAEMMERAFQLFVQGERSLDRPQGGLGLGLPLVQRLVEMHGGLVGVHSDGRGRGCCFTVMLPALRQSVPATPAPAPAAEPPGGPARRVLLVEDNPDALYSMAALLRMDGHQVIEANNGEEALDRAQSAWPDIAFVDIGLPDRNGYEVARALRALGGGRSLRLIALTGYGDAEHRRQSVASGFDQHLVKPVDPQTIGQLVHQVDSTA
jgi:signal transduction histidine kinase